MAIARADVDFLMHVRRKLLDNRLNVYKPHRNRAASAVVLRFDGLCGTKVARCFSSADAGATPDEVLQRLALHADRDAPPALTALFARRRTHEAGRWSGAVSFPGGRRDPVEDRDDWDTARRWAQHTMGMPIGTSDFVVLGRLPDAVVYSRDLGEGVATARFVVLHIGELTPSVRFAHHDVEAVTWAPITAFDPKNVNRTKERHPLRMYIGGNRSRNIEARRRRGPFLVFPSIPVPHFGALWGLPLTTMSTLLAVDGRPRLDWPLCHCTNPWVQWLVVNPVHGWLALRGSEFVGDYHGSHVIGLAIAVGLVVGLVFGVLWLVASFINACVLAATAPPSDGYRALPQATKLHPSHNPPARYLSLTAIEEEDPAVLEQQIHAADRMAHKAQRERLAGAAAS